MRPEALALPDEGVEAAVAEPVRLVYVRCVCCMILLCLVYCYLYVLNCDCLFVAIIICVCALPQPIMLPRVDTLLGSASSTCVCPSSSHIPDVANNMW